MNTKTVTEDDIAAFLINSPDFFERNADILASIQLNSPHGQRAVSLHERQMEILRDKIKGLELRMANMFRAAAENDQTHQKLQEWTLALLQERIPTRLPMRVVEGLQSLFNVPQVALRLWGLDDTYTSSVYSKPVSSDVQSFTSSMNGEPYRGRNPDLEAVHWLEDPASIRSVAILPLFIQSPQRPFGLLVLGSSDILRFSPDMGVDVLKNIATISSATLSRCLKETPALLHSFLRSPQGAVLD